MNMIEKLSLEELSCSLTHFSLCSFCFIFPIVLAVLLTPHSALCRVGEGAGREGHPTWPMSVGFSAAGFWLALANGEASAGDFRRRLMFGYSLPRLLAGQPPTALLSHVLDPASFPCLFRPGPGLRCARAALPPPVRFLKPCPCLCK